MRAVILVLMIGVSQSASAPAADGDAKKWLTGRWAPAATAAANTSDPAANPAGKPKAKIKGKSKRTATKKAAEEIPKLVVEFTKDGKVRLDGDPSILGEAFRVIKPLALFPMRFSPENKYLKINYQFTGDDVVEVSADHSWLLEKLSAGAREISPEKAAELNREYHPRETLRVAASSKQLTLTNEQGKSFVFRRYAGDSLDVAEGKRTQAELRKGLAPLESILRQQGINTGKPAKE
jgi:hypothetical protein